MKRLIRKPSFWVALIVSSFAMNLFLAVMTLHQHIRYPDDPRQHPQQHQQHVMSFFASSSTSNSQMGMDGSVGGVNQQLSESVLWRRMLQQDDMSTAGGGCGDRGLRSPTARINNTTYNDTVLLPPFGFRRHIQQFVEPLSSSLATNRPSAGQLRGSSEQWTTTTTTMKAGNTDSKKLSGHSTCFLPPSTVCDATRYSVIMYSKAQNLRRLLLNLMAFQTYPSVHDITLIVPSADLLHHPQVDNTEAYASRIWDWKMQGTIEIHFVESASASSSSSTLWASLSQLRPKESAILWVDGDYRKDWNGTMFLNNFRIWREHSRALVVTAAAATTVSSSSALSASLSVTITEEEEEDSTRNITSSGTSSISTNADHHEKTTNGDPDSWTCPFNRLHGTLMHRQWLCFLQHPVLGPLGNFITMADDNTNNDDDWDTTLNGLSILWNQLGEGHILALPPSQESSNVHSDSLYSATSVSRRQAAEEDTPSNPTAIISRSSSRSSSTGRKIQNILEYFGCPSCFINPVSVSSSVDNDSTCRQQPEP